jgi:hypothetical protein
MSVNVRITSATWLKPWFRQYKRDFKWKFSLWRTVKNLYIFVLCHKLKSKSPCIFIVRKCSETLHSYNERNYADPNRHNEPRVVSPSSVFRDGDWNMRGQGMTYTSSVSHDHYSSSKEKRYESIRSFESFKLW